MIFQEMLHWSTSNTMPFQSSLLVSSATCTNATGQLLVSDNGIGEMNREAFQGLTKLEP